MIERNKFNDARSTTYRTRCDIGFLSDIYAWRDEHAHITDTELVINGHPVMERWEENYMRDLADIATRNGGVILEVGFGMGISAQFVQSHAIEKHMIIEANTDVFRTLVQFSTQSRHPVVALHGFWQDVTKTLQSESIDGILFDTYPLTVDEIHQNHFSFFTEAFRLLRPGGVLTYYSDEILDFSKQHLEKLNDAGFTHIEKQVCSVRPPHDCQYWTSNTILAPIVTKGI